MPTIKQAFAVNRALQTLALTSDGPRYHYLTALADAYSAWASAMIMKEYQQDGQS